MKDWLQKISVSLLLALGELVLGVLLLINAAGLAGLVIGALGFMLVILGAFQLFRYFRLPREEAAKTWKLAGGAWLIALGVSAVVNQQWMVTMLGALAVLYGAMVLADALLMLQMTVDALRGGVKHWYLMAVSFAVTAVLATLLFIQPFADSAIWVFTGIMLLALAVLDGVYFVLSRKQKKEAGTRKA